MKHTFPAKQKYHKPTNIKEYDAIKLMTRPLLIHFDYASFVSGLNSLLYFQVKGR